MNISQQNIHGDNIIEIKLTIDIGRLKTIVETEKDRIKSVFLQIQQVKELHIIDESSIQISQKNMKNDLIIYYDEFIKKHESKLEILKHFFDEEDYYYEIDQASEHLRELIFSYKNQQTHKLTPEIMSTLINYHSQPFENAEDKDIMKLIIYYLYRYCFIGLK